MSPFHPYNERTGNYANPKECKKQNTWLNNKLMVKAMSFRYDVQTRSQGHCLEVIFLASPCLGGVFYRAGKKAMLACLLSTFLLYHMVSSLHIHILTQSVAAGQPGQGCINAQCTQPPLFQEGNPKFSRTGY